MAFEETQHLGWRRIGAMFCLVAVLTASVGHVAHGLDAGQTQSSTKTAVVSSASSLCPTCVALQSSFAEGEYRGTIEEGAVGIDSPSRYQNPALAGEFPLFFVRPPPSREAD